MSVYIKGMETPETCCDCPMCKLSPTGESLVCNYMLSIVPWDGKPLDCPLVPVPEHGRLIDADAFSAKIIEIVERQGYDDFYAQSLSVGSILREVAEELRGAGLDGLANAPTIIPAEEGDG